MRGTAHRMVTQTDVRSLHLRRVVASDVNLDIRHRQRSPPLR